MKKSIFLLLLLIGIAKGEINLIENIGNENSGFEKDDEYNEKKLEEILSEISEENPQDEIRPAAKVGIYSLF